MEPSTNVDGDRDSSRPSGRRRVRFNGAVDERRRRRRVAAVPGFLDGASMEPSTNVDGDASTRAPGRLAISASMEPSTNVDGDFGVVETVNGSISTLQWSRRRTSTETLVVEVGLASRHLASMEPSTNVDGDMSSVSAGRRYASLQWSRRRTSTETVPGNCIVVSGGLGIALRAGFEMWSR